MRKKLVGALVVLGMAYGVVFVHEMTHIFVSWGATGKFATCPSTGLPLGVDLYLGVFPRFFACVYPGALGINSILTNFASVIFALGILWFGQYHWHDGVKVGTFIGGTIIWLRYASYMTGLYYTPITVNGEITFNLGGDGFRILESFGLVGMVPGLLALMIGAVIVWERIRNSPEACQVSQDGTKNIDYVR